MRGAAKGRSAWARMVLRAVRPPGGFARERALRGEGCGRGGLLNRPLPTEKPSLAQRLRRRSAAREQAAPSMPAHAPAACRQTLGVRLPQAERALGPTVHIRRPGHRGEADYYACA
eukprot:scaffold527_cov368-Prasinococcus_capsulatus_cf.AAC.17